MATRLAGAICGLSTAETDELTRTQGLPLALHALGRTTGSDLALAELIASMGRMRR
jgi:hypothetical protein